MKSMDWVSLFSPVVWLFIGLAGVLLFASSVAAVLKWRIANNAPHTVIDNLVSRINMWWVMIGTIGLSFLFGKSGVVVLFLLISFYVLREFLSIVYTRRGDHSAMAASFYIALPMQYFFVWIEWYGLYSIFIPVFAFLLLPIFSATGADAERFLERTSKIQWGLMVSVFCISHVPALLTLPVIDFQGKNLLLIAFLVIIVQGSDVLQYIWGKLFGKHKVAPVLSPSKTWEGLIGGVVSAVALGAALHVITPFSPVQAGAMAFLICIMGFFGGLVMSAIKRDHGVKDWGSMIEGHGGMLDRADSLIFAAPVFFHAVRYGWVP